MTLLFATRRTDTRDTCTEREKERKRDVYVIT